MRTDALERVFREVHPHFLDSKYIAYMVLTQSCDLVRRGKDGVCHSRYITLACVRPLEDVLLRLLDQICTRVRTGAYLEKSRREAKELLGRILNQNEQKFGLFYLHPDADVGIAVPAVAMLQVSIAVRREHYGLVAESRSGALTGEFRSKLGWLVGNLYSRVGTTDWTEVQNGKKQVNAIIDAHLKSATSEKAPVWLSGEGVDAARKAGEDLEGLSRDALTKVVGDHIPAPLKQRVTIVVCKILRELLKDSEESTMPEAEIDRLQKRLNNDAAYSQLFRGL